MLMIRLQRIGRTNDPAFRIVVLEKERAAKSGRITEQVGTYNPRSKAFNLKTEKVKEWIGKGAQPTATLHNLLVKNGIIPGKKVSTVKRKNIVKPVKAAVPEAAPVAETPAA